jgi:HAD superfamily hydrolase (TIGR01509 family)
VTQKRKWYQKEIANRLLFFPGVVQFVQRVSVHYPLAIVSGASRTEITTALQPIHLLKYFPVIVSSDDVRHGKPDPEGLFLACAKLNEWLRQKISDTSAIEPKGCLVIEDAVQGIEMAHQAGMKCLAISNSYPAKQLKSADLVKHSLEEISLEELERLI